MGMDVWKVTMEHICTARQPVRGFLRHLSLYVDYEDGWGGSFESNAFFEAFEEDLEEKAKEYASDKGLSKDDAERVVAWVRNLPWEDGAISLNVNW